MDMDGYGYDVIDAIYPGQSKWRAAHINIYICIYEYIVYYIETFNHHERFDCAFALYTYIEIDSKNEHTIKHVLLTEL